MSRHLAQVNIGSVLGGPDDPRMNDFYSNLRRINALAERMPGFIWRLKNDSGESAVGLHWPGDPTMSVNLTVWESAEALERFVFQTAHRRIYARKHEFFEISKQPTVAMWWIAAGHIPSLEEAKQRLDLLVAHGPTEFAFGWAELPSAGIWRDRKCAQSRRAKPAAAPPRDSAKGRSTLSGAAAVLHIRRHGASDSVIRPVGVFLHLGLVCHRTNSRFGRTSNRRSSPTIFSVEPASAHARPSGITLSLCAWQPPLSPF